MADQADNLSAGTQVVSLVEVLGTNNSLVHPRGAVGLVTRTPTGEEKRFLVRFPDDFEFDLYDKDAAQFLDLATRLQMLDGTGLQTVPVLHRGPATAEELRALIGPSAFDSAFDNPVTGRTDHLMEGLYVGTEAGGYVTARAKIVRAAFVEKVKQSEHWQHQAMVPNELAEGTEIWG